MAPSEQIPQLFVSYSHCDERLKERFEVHLGPLKQTSKIEIWSDTRLSAGDTWESELTASLSRAALAVLLITADSLNSEFIQNREIPVLLDRRAKEGLRFVPVLAKACAWELVPWLNKIEIRPVDGKPVWRRGGDAERELKLIALEIDALAKVAKEAMEKATQKKLAQEEIERARREQETAVSNLVRNAHANITAVLNDDNQAASIYAQIMADAQKQRMERFQIFQDLQSKIFEITQDVTINKKRTADEAFKNMDGYIRGS